MEQQSIDEKSDNIDFKGILFKVIANWRLFLFSLILLLLVAFLYNKYKYQEFVVNTSILINQNKPALDVGRLSLSGFESTVDNEMNKLSSYTLINTTLSRINYGVTYYRVNGFKKTELFDECPFVVQVDSSKSQPINIPIKVVILNDSLVQIVSEKATVQLCNFKTEECSESTKIDFYSVTCKINSFFQNKYFAFVLLTKPGLIDLRDYVGQKYEFNFESRYSLVSKYKTMVLSNNKSTSIINISLTGNNPRKIAYFLNTFSEVYLEKSVEKKLSSTSNTIGFIEKQISEIQDSLKISESQLLNFKSTRKLMDIETESQRVFQKLEKLQNQQTQSLVKLRYYEYLKKYLESKESDNKELIAPASIGIDDPLMNNLLSDLITALNERRELASISKKENPYIVAQDQKILSIRKVLAENIKNVINSEKITLKEYDNEIVALSEQAGTLPQTQRDLFNYERKYKVIDELYTFLLTKRSEIQIAKSSIMPENEIVDKADSQYAVLISPKKNQSYTFAVIFGLGLPLVILLLIDFLNTKVRTLQEIERITGFQLLGKIVRTDTKLIKSIMDDPESFMAEDFRFIRTNFQFIDQEKVKQTILVTSSLMNEGKSFVSLNIALSFSQNNKKTVLLNFDMRKPLNNKPFNCELENGLSTYLSRKCEIDELICPSPYTNLDVILPGPVPPNSSELISSVRCELLFEYLKTIYDIIVIDTPPVGIIPDALLLVCYSNINLFVVRHNHTDKHILADVIDTIRKRKIPDMHLIINDIDISRGNYYNNAYKYNYSYNYNHYKKKKTSIFDKIFKIGDRKS